MTDTSVTISETRDDPRPAAEAIISRSNATLNDIHAYALDKIASLENLLASLKLEIEATKNRAQMQTTVYVEMVDDALRAAQGIQSVISKLEKQVRSL